MTNKVSTRENMIPPTTTIPRGTRLVAAAPRLMAIGNAPKEVARLVIRNRQGRQCRRADPRRVAAGDRRSERVAVLQGRG